MHPQTRLLLARISIPIAAAVAVLGAVTGNWFVVGVMVLAIILQTISYQLNRRSRR
jgi:hypothetical protein